MSDDEPTDSTITVLIVEDETDVATLYEMWLRERYVIRTAYSGEEALEQLDDSIDVVLLDRRMPGLSGDELLEKIRERGIDCRVAIVSAVTPDFDVLEMGFDDYLTKPVDKQEVIAAVERMDRRSNFDDSLQEYYRLVASRAAIRETKSETELEDNDEYRELEAKIDRKRETVDEVLTSFDEDDFEAAFNRFDE